MQKSIVAAAVAIVLVSPCMAGDGLTAIRRPTHIPAEPLSQALSALAKQGKFEVLYRSDLVRGLRTQGANGELTVQEALALLLRGTGLSYEFLTNNTVTIVSSSQAAQSLKQKADPRASDDERKASGTPRGKEGKRNSSRGFRLDQGTGGAAAGNDSMTSLGQAAAPSDSHEDLAEIIVTAQRRPQSIQSVPISMSAFSQDTLDELHIQTLADLAAVVPGLVVTSPGDGVQAYTDIAIRGIYSNDNSPTTAIYINDTPIMIRQSFAAGYSGSPQPDIFDLERVEVLRGPQGTLFGASAMGGAVRYITRQPDMASSSGYAKAEVGFTHSGSPSYSVGAAFGAPIVPERLGFRLSAWYQSSGGFVDMENPYSGAITRNANSASTYVLQGSLAWVPVEGLKITPAFFIQHHHSANSDQALIDRGFLPNADPGKYVVGANIQSPVYDDLGMYSLAVTYALPGMSLESNTSYVNRTYHDIDDWVGFLPEFVGAPPGPFPGLPNVNPYDRNDSPTHQWQQELRLVSQLPDSRVSWVVGVYFRRTSQQTGQRISTLSPFTEALYGESSDEFFGVPDFVINGEPFSSYTHFTAVDQQKAVFGNLSWDVSSRLTASMGVRVEQTSVVDQQEIFAGPIAGTAYGTAYPTDQRETPITPRVSLTYQYSPDAMVYANAAKGFRPGGSNSPLVTQNPQCQDAVKALGLSSIPDTYDADSLWSYEVGTKQSLFDRRLVVDASAFYVDWTRIQTNVGLTGCGLEFTTNHGKAISQGFDLQVEAKPLRGLRLMGDVGYTHAYYPDAAYGAPSGGVAPILSVAGEKLADVIPWTAALSVEYSWSIARILPAARSYVRADYRYLDSVPGITSPADVFYDPAVGPDLSDGYRFLNLRLGLTRGDLDVSLYADNVTHAHPRLDLSDFGYLSATAIRPLTAGITAIYHF